MCKKLLIKNCHKRNCKKMATTTTTTRMIKTLNRRAITTATTTSSLIPAIMTLTTGHHCRPLFLSCKSFLWQMILFIILLLLQSPSMWAGSCREAQMCCNGRDSSCVVQKAPINAIIEDLSDKPCYCDHACLKLGDCCTDFKDHCRVVDCQVSDWSQWSVCNTACGSGIMTRTRQVLQTSQNGGKHCPVLIQKRGCQGFRCHGRRDKKILHEIALLLPASLSHNHHFNVSGVRRNLRGHYRETYQHNREQEYCVEFEVLRTSKTCHKLPPYNLMIEGDRIGVRCDVEAFVQDFISSTDNNLILSTPHSTQHSNNTLYTKFDLTSNSNEEDFNDSDENMIDNNSSSSSSSISSSSGSSSDERNDYDTALITTKSTKTTSTSTTTTTTTPYAPPQSVQYHCRGEGLPGRTTRWSALAAPSCRGKWLRLTLDTPTKCKHSQFIFV